MLHIVFEPSAAEVLEQSFVLDETLQGEILVIEDDYAVGPLQNISDADGWQARKSWWEKVLEHSPYIGQLAVVDDKLKVHQLKKKLEEDLELQAWIWIGQNQHDVCGYYWLMIQLAKFQGRLQILYLNNLPFINEKGGIFYPTNLYEIRPSEFLKAKRLAREITLSEFELDPDEWKKLCNENAIVRTLEGGKKIISQPETFYDKEILTILGKSSMKLHRLLGNLLTKMRIKTGDAFLVWRIKEMIAQNQILIQGSWEKGWKDITLKATGGELFVEVDTTVMDDETD
ncbi:DUF3658 domain-containing protein [Arachidicoccus sp.]|uniref:DUF1835 domain-containing protein n=1 Tax=Arachidicoccus sp. TaxID=1872624 RepID=UPI003D198F6D